MKQRFNDIVSTQFAQGQGKQRILMVARRLFITRGIDAVSYGDIAEEIGTTRANIHYHFGHKAELVNTVFTITFAEVRAALDAIWLTPHLSLMERLELLFADAQARYQEFNNTTYDKVPWSLSARAYLGFSAMEPELLEGILAMSNYFEEGATHAVQLAIGAGELKADAPVERIMLLITPLWHFGSAITQFSDVERLREHYAAVQHTILAAYGVPLDE